MKTANGEYTSRISLVSAHLYGSMLQGSSIEATEMRTSSTNRWYIREQHLDGGHVGSTLHTRW